MENQQEFQERPVTFERPKNHFVFLVAPDGAMLGLDDGGELALFDEADDRVIWDRASDGVKHVATGRDVSADIDERPLHAASRLRRGRPSPSSGGPEKLPSEYLEHLQREGWVCLSLYSVAGTSSTDSSALSVRTATRARRR